MCVALFMRAGGTQIIVEEINDRATKLADALAAVNAENQRLAKKRGMKDYAVPPNASEVC